ncbi:MAG: two-component sensor histidine kinase [Microbacterium sp.]|nr:two-component sensor histidine kinase [Microbacterium sp.]
MDDDLDDFHTLGRAAFLAVGAGAVGLALFALAAPPLHEGEILLQLLVGAAAIVALTASHRHPAIVTGIALVAGAVTPIAAPAGWAMAFLLGLRCSRRVAVGVVLAVLASSAGLCALSLARWADPAALGLTALVAVFSALMAVGCGLAGIVVGQQRRHSARVMRLFLDALHQVPRISERAARAERARIARLLHDDLGHNLALINLFVSSIETAGLSDHEIREAVATIREQNRAAARALASAVADLADDAAEASLQNRLDELMVEVRRAGLSVDVQVRDDLALDQDATSFVVRTVREGLTNAIKYASPLHAHVTVSQDEPASTTTVTIVSPLGQAPREVGFLSSGSGIRRLQQDARSIGGEVSFATDRHSAYLSLRLPPDLPLSA